MKTKFDSYSLNGIPKGCKLCLKGKKGVLFITGLCSRNCEYCPLSNKRKNKNKIYFNEREINSFKDLMEELKLSNVESCSITGGDPLINLKRTLGFAKFLKQKSGKRFHIHIYLSTKLVNKNNLSKLSKFIDEVRFHPDLNKNSEEEIKKISLASKFWDKKNIGIELPCFPDKKQKILKFILRISSNISFVNLNELELGESNEKFILKNYKLNEEGYTTYNSINAGIWILNELRKQRTKLKIHLCTAKTKNWHQYKNRLKRYQKIPFSKKTNEGTLIYFFVKPNKNLNKILSKKDFFFDKFKKRLIINPVKLNFILKKVAIWKAEEYPTFDREEVLLEKLN